MQSVETEVEIAAPINIVWRVLTDFDQYPQWHPVFTQVTLTGNLEKNAQGALHVQMKPGGGTTKVPMTLTEVEPNTTLSWIGGVGPAWFSRGYHYRHLKPLADGGTLLVEGEQFTGLLFWLLWPFQKKKMKDEYENTKNALKAHCESLANAG